MSDAESVPAPIRRNGFTNETLEWRSWLVPLEVASASPLQLEVLDESHPQARTSAYLIRVRTDRRSCIPPVKSPAE